MMMFLMKSLVVDVTVLCGGDGVFGSYAGDAANLVDAAGVKWIFKQRSCHSLTFANQSFKSCELEGNDLNKKG